MKAMVFLRTYYFFRNYLNETVSFVITSFGVFLAYYFSVTPELQMYSLVSLALTSYVVVIFLRNKVRDFYYIAFDKYEDKEGWFGVGVFDYYPIDQAFLIKDSDEGFIFSKSLNWVDCNVECDFNIIKDALGVLIRATDLSNKLMLQLSLKENGIVPHFWANGGFIKKDPIPLGLGFDMKLKKDRWYKLKMNVYRNNVKILIMREEKVVVEKHWEIPSAKLSFPIRENDNEKLSNGVLDLKKDYSYGTIGFRNGHTESALVRKLLIQKI